MVATLPTHTAATRKSPTSQRLYQKSSKKPFPSQLKLMSQMFLADATLPDHTAAENADQFLLDHLDAHATHLPHTAATCLHQSGLMRGNPETSIMVLSDTHFTIKFPLHYHPL